MGVPLEIGKMFFYIMIPITCFHYYSHQDPETFRKSRAQYEVDLFGYGKKKTEEYVKKRAASEFLGEGYHPEDAFWKYGIGLKMVEEQEEKEN